MKDAFDKSKKGLNLLLSSFSLSAYNPDCMGRIANWHHFEAKIIPESFPFNAAHHTVHD